jgi:glycerol kinase
VARAAIEAMAFQTRDVVDAMRTDAGTTLRELRADGGASVMDLLLQLQADLLGAPVARPAILETTALGAAFLAGLAEGMWGSRDDVARSWRLDREFLPRATADAEERYARWREAVGRASGWAR